MKYNFRFKKILVATIIGTCVFASNAWSASKASSTKAVSKEEMPDSTPKSIPVLMRALRARIQKFKWDQSFFSDDGWQSHGYSVNGMPLLYWTCGDSSSQNTALILSSVHGDEVTPVYFGFRTVEWLKARPELCKDRFVIVAPIVNPDGFLRYTTGTRTNFNKVDLNRNFDTPDWLPKAHSVWKTLAKGQRRYYPGDGPGSEPETQFQVWLVNTFKPTKILSVHAPLNIMDYDGPSTKEAREFSKKYVDSCENLKTMIKQSTPDLHFEVYGNFPGSLGRFAGVERGIPVLTAELPTASPEMATVYFGMLERGTRVFLEYELKGRPAITKTEDTTTQEKN